MLDGSTIAAVYISRCQMSFLPNSGAVLPGPGSVGG
jgi:hypothetical protein